MPCVPLPSAGHRHSFLTPSRVRQVPSEHLALLVEQTEWLSGSRAPRQPLARRAYLDEAWRRTLSLPGS